MISDLISKRFLLSLFLLIFLILTYPTDPTIVLTGDNDPCLTLRIYPSATLNCNKHWGLCSHSQSSDRMNAMMCNVWFLFCFQWPPISFSLHFIFSCPGQLNKWHCRSVCRSQLTIRNGDWQLKQILLLSRWEIHLTKQSEPTEHQRVTLDTSRH